MNSVSAFVALLLGVGVFAAASADAENTEFGDLSALNRGEVTGTLRLRPSRRAELQSSQERCSVSHQGRYRDGRYRQAGVRFFEFEILIKSNCRSTLMKCLVQYRTLIFGRSHAGNQTTTARAPWWESSLQTVTLRPGETIETRPLGPTRRNAGEYEIDCARIGSA